MNLRGRAKGLIAYNDAVARVGPGLGEESIDEAGPVLQGPAPQQEGVGCGDPLCCEPVQILVEVRHLPATLLKVVVQLRFGFPLLCITPSSVRWEVTVSRITRSPRKRSSDRHL